MIIGTNRSAIGTLVERSSRSTLLVHLPRLAGYGDGPVVKNGPELGGYGAEAMAQALTVSMTQLPEQLRKTLTWDRGKELSDHAAFALATGTKVYFADPHSPWQRPTNENTNGLLRQYFPKGTDLSRWGADELAAVAYTLNNRPRKTPRLEHPSRGVCGAVRVSSKPRCCIDRLNPPNIVPFVTPNGSRSALRSRRSGPKVTRMTTRWPRR